jgi:hypothetical protein
VLKRIILGLLLAGLGIVGSSRAENLSQTQATATSGQRPFESLKIPSTDYVVELDNKASGETYPSRSLIKALKQWLSSNFNLRLTFPDPIIQFTAVEALLPLRYQGFLSDWPRDIVFHGQQAVVSFDEMVSARDQKDLIAAYDDEMKTIYLPDTWTGNTPAQLSVLVHEMVHHLQGARPMRYDCPQAREEIAYAAQAKWLALFGRNLNDEFNIDPFTVAMSTRCIY